MTYAPRHARRIGAGTALLLSATLLAGLSVADVTAPGPAQAQESADLVTTSSTRTVAWTDQNPRHPDDAANAFDSSTYRALKDFRLRVSQTSDLLNQTVQIAWTGGATTGNGTFLQLMQCWSDGPDVPPTREQCAYGGIGRDGADGSGAGRTRALGADPRERTYLYDGDLNVVAVDGAVAGPTWSDTARLVLGTNQQVCPVGSTSHSVSMVPPRDVVAAGRAPASLVVQPRTAGLPGSLTRLEGTTLRAHSTVTPSFRLTEVARTAGLASLPLGVYRVQLGCLDASGAERARFVGYLEQAEVAGAGVWRRGVREGGVFVPFDPLGSTPDTAPTDPYVRDEILEYLKPRSTNELWQARNRTDGSGSAFMEMQTDLEAQHLGCGKADGVRVRSCWVVAVPRWTKEPNGAELNGRVLYSPLSQTLWDHRVQVPLAFAPVAAGCRIGSGLKQVLSNDAALNALRSWQPTFCGNPLAASSVLGPLQDFSVRAGFAQPNRMGVVTVPDRVSGSVVAAPIATSGVVVAFNADRQLPIGSKKIALDGTRANVMNLNARLVAKLLTQSYDSGAAPNGGKTSGYNTSVFSGGFSPTFTPTRNFPTDNPRTLYQDPEFLRLNPDFDNWLKEGAFIQPASMADLLVAANDTDAYEVLWRWVVGDPVARAFLDGAADGDGMLINPYYKGQISEATSSFPLLDPTCVDNLQAPEADGFPLLCQINNHPRVEDDSDAAQAAVRGDTKRVNQAPAVLTGNPSELTYRAEPRQEQSEAGMMVITTSAVAERFNLPSARLQNAEGAFVAPDATSMAAARDQMPVRADGVLTPNPAAVRGFGYPLTANAYALVDVSRTTQVQNDAFATILEYAAGDGQRSGTAVGQLPPGYAPLSADLVARTRAAALLLRNPSSLLPRPVLAAAASPPGQAGLTTQPLATTAPAVAAVRPPTAAPSSPVVTPSRASVPAAPAVVAPRETPVSTVIVPRVQGRAPPQAPNARQPRTTQRRNNQVQTGQRRTDSTSAGAPDPAPAAPAVAKPPAQVLTQVGTVATTSSPTTPLRWTLPVLLLLGLLAAYAGRVLPTLGRTAP